MASGPITSWQADGETMETVRDFIFLGSKITTDGDCNHEMKRYLFLGRKAMTNLDSILKSRDITLLTKVRIVKAMVFSVVMYGCESWAIKKAVVHFYLFATPWTVVCQAPLFMKFSRQEHWNGLPFPFPGDFPDPAIKTESLHCQVDSLLPSTRAAATLRQTQNDSG